MTTKICLGLANSRLALECALAAERGGARQLVVHGRTRDEGYRPPANWEWIGQIRQRLGIPVICNGDIWTLEDYWKAHTLSGCQDVMLGRGALADPWLAMHIRHWQTTGERLGNTSWQSRVTILCEFAALERSVLSPSRALPSSIHRSPEWR